MIAAALSGFLLLFLLGFVAASCNFDSARAAVRDVMREIR